MKCTAVSEKWLLHYQETGPDKMVDSGFEWSCCKSLLVKRKRRRCLETSEPCCPVHSQAGQQGQESRLDVKDESRGVDGWMEE